MFLYEDVLDRIGRTPRELAWLHLHVDQVLRRADGSALATAWLQAAYEPAADGALRILNATGNPRGGPEVSRLRLPPLERGQVLRWLLPLELHDLVAQLLFVVDSHIPEGAERVRPAWKLFETVEIPKESEMEPIFRTRGSGSHEPDRKLYPPMDLGPGLLAAVVPGEFEPLSRARVEHVWRPGEPLPAPAGP